MAKIAFTPNLKRHLEVNDAVVPAGTVRSALDAVFSDNPRLRGYILDDQGGLRQHVVVFVDGTRAVDREDLSDVVGEDSEVYVMQALSGG
jgi:molybdopterin synthase sulfur carrier subunit